MDKLLGKRLPITLISTADMQSDREHMLRRMIESVAAFRARSGANVTLLILLQRCNEVTLKQFREQWPEWIRASADLGRLSLSSARNRLLDTAEARDALRSDGIFAFPDDDCWYPDGTLDHIASSFESDPLLGFWFGRYGMDAAGITTARLSRPSLQTVVSFASSNTIVVRNAVAAKIGRFDESLGVGATLSGGEDTDYAIRAFNVSPKSGYLDARCVGHRDPQISFKAKYYPGSLRAIVNNTKIRPMEIQVLTRKLLVGVWWVLTGKMSALEYLRGVRSAMIRRG